MVRDVVDENGGDYTCNNKIFYLIRFMTLVIVFGMQNVLYDVDMNHYFDKIMIST